MTEERTEEKDIHEERKYHALVLTRESMFETALHIETMHADGNCTYCMREGGDGCPIMHTALVMRAVMGEETPAEKVERLRRISTKLYCRWYDKRNQAWSRRAKLSETDKEITSLTEKWKEIKTDVVYYEDLLPVLNEEYMAAKKKYDEAVAEVMNRGEK